jgi:hypothetical protein
MLDRARRNGLFDVVAPFVAKETVRVMFYIAPRSSSANNYDIGVIIRFTAIGDRSCCFYQGVACCQLQC